MAEVNSASSTSNVRWAINEFSAGATKAYIALTSPIIVLTAKVWSTSTAVLNTLSPIATLYIPGVTFLGGAAYTAKKGNDYLYKDYGPSDYVKTKRTLAGVAIAVASVAVFGVFASHTRTAAGHIAGLLAGGVLAGAAFYFNSNPLLLALKEEQKAQRAVDAAQTAFNGVDGAEKRAKVALDTASNNPNFSKEFLDMEAERKGWLLDIDAINHPKPGYFVKAHTDEEKANLKKPIEEKLAVSLTKYEELAAKVKAELDVRDAAQKAYDAAVKDLSEHQKVLKKASDALVAAQLKTKVERDAKAALV